MKIALVQQHATRDREDNIARGIEALEEAASQGVQLVTYPELAFNFFLPQYHASPDSLDLAEPIPGPTTRVFSKKAKELKVVIVLNLFEREGDRTYDSSPVINADGKIVGKTRMVHITDYPCFHERGYYSPGNLGAGVFDTAVGRIGIAICYDRHFPEYMRALALKGAELVLVPQAGAVDEWPPGMFEAELQVAAFQNGYFAALVNRVGREDRLTFAGESFVTDPRGQIIAHAPAGKDCILYADIDLEQLKGCPARKYFLLDRKQDICEIL
ncbi:carbon-nitrogen hydrolase family protein [Candidatus Bathyarchaeota archaeon]|nr:carbon-nitrogen hydrolase family protein [Candidatus Bathyarchaeota archaeon]